MEDTTKLGWRFDLQALLLYVAPSRPEGYGVNSLLLTHPRFSAIVLSSKLANPPGLGWQAS